SEGGSTLTTVARYGPTPTSVPKSPGSEIVNSTQLGPCACSVGLLSVIEDGDDAGGNISNCDALHATAGRAATRSRLARSAAHSLETCERNGIRPASPRT